MRKARKYCYLDKPDLNQWWAAHNLPAIPTESLPKTGFVVQGVAAGFLYKTDSDVVFIENFISNPRAYWEERQNALDQITAALLQHAITKGFNYAMALTQSQAVYERALKFGFSTQGAYQVMNKDLRKERI